MSDQPSRMPAASGHNALQRAEPTLPADWYFDPEIHRREIETVWRRNWLYVCRSSELADPLSYRTFELGDQNIVLLRAGDGDLRAYHNACRHRGSILCPEKSGRLKSKLITCPYHQWSYACDDGRLASTTSFAEPDGFDKADYPLFPVSVAEWRGCVLVNLDAKAVWDPETAFQRPPDNFVNFPLEDMIVGHTWQKVMACNWKTFWENFNECLHCPAVHPELSELVPLFSRRIINTKDVPDWPEHADKSDPKYRGGLRAGAETWSSDGDAQGRTIASLTAEDLARGHTYASAWPGFFLGGYPDHVRIVRLNPLGPEKTELIAEWLFPPETLADTAYDMSKVVDFGVLVMEQDAGACELNQRGLHAAPFDQGVLMPEEYLLKRFQDWLRGEIG